MQEQHGFKIDLEKAQTLADDCRQRFTISKTNWLKNGNRKSSSVTGKDRQAVGR